MFRCETVVDGKRISDVWLTRGQVNQEVSSLLDDGWKWLVRSSGWLSLWAMNGEHMAIVRFTR